MAAYAVLSTPMPGSRSWYFYPSSGISLSIPGLGLDRFPGWDVVGMGHWPVGPIYSQLVLWGSGHSRAVPMIQSLIPHFFFLLLPLLWWPDRPLQAPVQSIFRNVVSGPLCGRFTIFIRLCLRSYFPFLVITDGSQFLLSIYELVPIRAFSSSYNPSLLPPFMWCPFWDGLDVASLLPLALIGARAGCGPGTCGLC